MPLLKFRNFLSASRKRNMIPFGMVMAGNTQFIDLIEDYGSSGTFTPLGVTGIQNGTNTVFNASGPVSQVYLNGLLQQEFVDYTVTGFAVTFAIAPQASDTIIMF